MADAGVLTVIAQDFIRPDRVDAVLPLYRELVALTLREPRCLGYTLTVNQADPGHFVFIETWPDRAALDAHCASEHFQRLVPLIDAHQRAPGTYLFLDPLPAPTR